jgi:hypothetical protein
MSGHTAPPRCFPDSTRFHVLVKTTRACVGFDASAARGMPGSCTGFDSFKTPARFACAKITRRHIFCLKYILYKNIFPAHVDFPRRFQIRSVISFFPHVLWFSEV